MEFLWTLPQVGRNEISITPFRAYGQARRKSAESLANSVFESVMNNAAPSGNPRFVLAIADFPKLLRGVLEKIAIAFSNLYVYGIAALTLSYAAVLSLIATLLGSPSAWLGIVIAGLESVCGVVGLVFLLHFPWRAFLSGHTLVSLTSISVWLTLRLDSREELGAFSRDFFGAFGLGASGLWLALASLVLVTRALVRDARLSLLERVAVNLSLAVWQVSSRELWLDPRLRRAATWRIRNAGVLIHSYAERFVVTEGPTDTWVTHQADLLRASVEDACKPMVVPGADSHSKALDRLLAMIEACLAQEPHRLLTTDELPRSDQPNRFSQVLRALRSTLAPSLPLVVTLMLIRFNILTGEAEKSLLTVTGLLAAGGIMSSLSPNSIQGPLGQKEILDFLKTPNPQK